MVFAAAVLGLVMSVAGAQAASAEVGYQGATYAVSARRLAHRLEAREQALVRRGSLVGHHGAVARRRPPHLRAGPDDAHLDGHRRRRRHPQPRARRRAVGRGDGEALHRLAHVLLRREARRRGDDARQRRTDLALLLRRGERHLVARRGVPPRHQHGQDRDARHRPRLDRHALGHLGAEGPGHPSAPRLRQSLGRSGAHLDAARAGAGLAGGDGRRRLLGHPVRRQPHRRDVQQRGDRRDEDLLRRPRRRRRRQRVDGRGGSDGL